MPKLNCGEIGLNYLEQGMGPDVVLAIHGNLGCADWLAPVFPSLPSRLRVIAPDWRGCGASDKPPVAEGFANYRMEIHARDHLALLDRLGVERCHLYGHSTGGIIVSHLLAMAPERFDRVLMLDPVSPWGLQLNDGQIDILKAMQRSEEIAFAGMASAAPTLFVENSLRADQSPRFAENTSLQQREAFMRIVANTRQLSDGIWFGVPHLLAEEWESGSLSSKVHRMTHEHLILWGKLDAWIPREHLVRMTQELPKARLEEFPFVGHSMNLEQPMLLARVFERFFCH